jgi:hypothetical protein
VQNFNFSQGQDFSINEGELVLRPCASSPHTALPLVSPTINLAARLRLK